MPNKTNDVDRAKNLFSDAWTKINEQKKEQGYLNATDMSLEDEIMSQMPAVREELAKMREDEVRQRCMDLTAELIMTEYKAGITLTKALELQKVYNQFKANNKRAKMKELMRIIVLLLRGF